MPKFPHVEVAMVGEDGNAFAIIGRVAKALRRAGVDAAEIDAFKLAAMDSDYDHLLQTVIRTVTTF